MDKIKQTEMFFVLILHKTGPVEIRLAWVTKKCLKLSD